jgi:hypothetical protein
MKFWEGEMLRGFFPKKIYRVCAHGSAEKEDVRLRPVREEIKSITCHHTEIKYITFNPISHECENGSRPHKGGWKKNVLVNSIMLPTP